MDKRKNKSEFYTVYRAASPSGKVYIGITKQLLRDRINGHNSNSRSLKRAKVFHKAIKKYGQESIKWDVIVEGLTKEEAESWEIDIIEMFNSTDRRYGYNMAKGGMAGNIMTRESMDKKVRTMTDLYYNNSEWISTQSKITKDRIASDPNWSQKQSDYINSWYKQPGILEQQAEHLRRLHSDIENARKRAISMGGKPFMCEQTGKVYHMLGDAVIDLYNIKLHGEGYQSCKKSISACLNNPKRHKSYKGYTFIYLTDSINLTDRINFRGK